ncbi:MAG: hypothetical protein AB1898_10240 [Acidobacteriota bacterium]
MNDRAKRIVIGVGVMYAAQAAILLAAHYLTPHTGPHEIHHLLASLGYTLAAFVIGGYVMGWLAEEILIVEPTLAACGALLIDLLFTRAGLLNGLGVFPFSLTVQDQDFTGALTIAAIAIVSAVAGALAGERRTVPEDDWADQVFTAVGMAGLVLGPFFLLGVHLPLGYLLLVGLAVAAGIGFATYRYERDLGETDEVSISHPVPHESRH